MPFKDPEARKEYEKRRWASGASKPATPKTAYHREWKRNLRANMTAEEKAVLAAYRAQWLLKNREAVAEKRKLRYAERREEIRAHRKVYQAENLEHRRAVAAAWQKANPDKCRALAMARLAAKLKATPKWLTEAQHQEIKNWYTKAVEQGKEVDHIVPLKGKTVCGLHVPWNMQLLTRLENLSKGNRMTEEAA